VAFFPPLWTYTGDWDADEGHLVGSLPHTFPDASYSVRKCLPSKVLLHPSAFDVR
jgi:hypothetical protein